MFLPLTWTVVHPIDSDSPLWGKSAAEIERLQPEVMILIKAYDDTFSQTVLTRRSYTFPEFVFGARFAPAFHVDPADGIVLIFCPRSAIWRRRKRRKFDNVIPATAPSVTS